MAVTQDARDRGFSPRRRSLLLGGLGGVTVAGIGTLGAPGAAAADSALGGARTSAEAAAAAAADFDFDTGNIIRDLIANRPDLTAIIAPMDVTLLIRVTHLVQNAWFDALAPYHPTAVGVYSRLGRRPAAESATNRNKNIAALHATYQVIKSVMAAQEPLFREMLTSVGLNPDDESENRTSPVGIGNLAGKAVVRARERDGMNQLGDEGGRRYNRKPYFDYTGYVPVNSAYELRNPSRWQPQLTPHRRRNGVGEGDMGIFTVQHFVTPQMRLTKPYSFRDPAQFSLPAPRHSDHRDRRTYKRSVDEILEASAGLTDEQKIKAEVFDNKLLGIGFSVLAAAEAHDLDLDGWVHLFMTNSVSMFDGLVAAWHQKHRYDAVRPVSAVRHVYGNSPVTGWGGPGVGTVDDLPADQWASYLNVGDHPEYPSGSTTLCSAEAQATRRFLDSDTLDWTYSAPAGSAVVEPGITPAADLQVHWDTWTAFVDDCATSRVWGGVHFSETVRRSVEFGIQLGDLAYEYVQKYIQGTVDD
ncbi:DUF6851 domain-containing protein [Streptomyces sp. URMC 129]|uniref:DUF6851 domain-containing protein n=1 Tax=Streptomyces sp. URMC 129 TaxID=3423407 RepID=UPI003F196817